MRKKREKVISLLLVFVLMTSAISFAYAEDTLPPIQEEGTTIQKEIALCEIHDIESVIFDGGHHKPKVFVYDGEVMLTEGVDYQVTYGENLHAGTGQVFITGIGLYHGEITKSFNIEKAEITVKGSNAASTGNPKVSWKKVNGAAKYKVYYATKKNGTYKYLTSTDKLSYIHTKAERSKIYYYQVKAFDVDGKTVDFEVSQIVKLTCKLPRPEVHSSTILKTGKPKLSWKKIKGAEKYVVYRAAKKDGSYQHMVTTKNTYWTNTKAVAGKKYYYKVKAIDTDNRSADSALSTYHVRSCDLSRPVVDVDLTSKAKPELSWKKITGAEKYEVFRASSKNGTYKSIGLTKNIYYVDSTAKSGKSYYYRVRAIDKDNSNANSAKSLKDEIYVVDLSKKLVALTFDDGPGPYTKSIVNALKNNHAKATFYVLGQRVKYYPEELKAIHEGGNEIGNHSYSHPILSYESGSTIESQMERTDKAVKLVVGIVPKTMRPPGGGVNSTVKKKVGKPLIMWNVDTRDWETRDAQSTINCVMREASDGDIILMHDIHEPTKDAALKLIPKLKKKGFELVTVSELAKFKGKNLKNGTVYYSL